jgi:hypothetical protein
MNGVCGSRRAKDPRYRFRVSLAQVVRAPAPASE